MAPEKRVNVVDNTGKVFNVPESQLAAVLADRVSGFRLETPEEAKAALDSLKYGTLGQQVITAAEGLAGGVTGNLSELAETKLLGVKPEDIKGRKTENELTRDISEGIGIVAPLPISKAAAGARGLKGALGAASKLTAPVLATEAGELVAAGARKLVGEEAKTLVGRAAQKAVTSGAQLATEGAAFGAMPVVSQYALGDPNLTAQSALEQIGTSALLFGGLGAGGGVLGALAKEAAASGVGRDIGKKVADWLPEFEAQRAIKATWATQSDIARAERQLGRDNLYKIAREGHEMGLVSPFSTAAKTLEKSEALMEASGTRMGQILEEAEAAGARPKGISDITARVRKEILAPLEANPLEQATAQQVKAALEGYDNLFAQNLGFKELHAIRKQVSDKIYGLRGTADPQATAIKDALHDFRGILSDEINKGLEASGIGSATWKQANREYQVAATMAGFAEKGVQREVGNNQIPLTSLLSGGAGLIAGGPIGGAALGAASFLARKYGAGLQAAAAKGLRGALDKGAAESLVGKTVEAAQKESVLGTAAPAESVLGNATGNPTTVAALSQLEKANKAVADNVATLAAAVVSGVGAVGRGVRAEAAHVATDAIAKDEREYQEKMEQVRAFANSPAQLQERLFSATEELFEHAPAVAQAVVVAETRKVAYLNAKFPPMPKLGPLGPRLKAPKSEVWRFNKVNTAINKPTILLERASKGILTPEEVEAVRACAPEILQQMQTALLEKVTSQKKPVPYKQRLMLSMLFGQSMDGTTTPEAIQAAQLAHALPSARSPDSQLGGGSPVKTSQQGLSKLNVAGQMRLPGQSSDIRRDGLA